jgi:uncharacterized protein YdhG (YjbR/CyaY superfamily)
MAKTDFKDIDEYIASTGKDEREVLEKIRQTIRQAVPDAEEVISYQIPAFKHHGFVVYLSAYKGHYSLSFPPPGTVFDEFKAELAGYKLSKSTIQLPKNHPMPYELIGKMAAFRAKENAEAAAAKAAKKGSP